MSSKQTYLIGWINFESICLPSLEKRELQHGETTQFQNANSIFVKKKFHIWLKSSMYLYVGGNWQNGV